MHDRKAMNCSALLLGIEREIKDINFIVWQQLFMAVFSLERRTFENLKRISWLTRIVIVQPVFLDHVGSAYAAGEGNVDGGGGSMGQGSSQNFWSPGDEGVRVSVTSDHKVVGMPIDLTNKKSI